MHDPDDPSSLSLALSPSLCHFLLYSHHVTLLSFLLSSTFTPHLLRHSFSLSPFHTPSFILLFLPLLFPSSFLYPSLSLSLSLSPSLSQSLCLCSATFFFFLLLFLFFYFMFPFYSIFLFLSFFLCHSLLSYLCPYLPLCPVHFIPPSFSLPPSFLPHSGVCTA